MKTSICTTGNKVFRPTTFNGLSMFQDLDQMMSQLFNQTPSHPCTAETCWSPRIDVREENDSFVIIADLPGMEKNEISIAVQDDVLTISGERKVELSDEQKRQTHRRERLTGKFSRSMSFPDEINSNGIRASFDNGVLTVNAPKTEPVKPRQIEID